MIGFGESPCFVRVGMGELLASFRVSINFDFSVIEKDMVVGEREIVRVYDHFYRL